MSDAFGARPLAADHHGPPLSRAGPGCVYCGDLNERSPGSGSGSGRIFAEVSRRAPTVPGSLRPDDLRYSFPSSPLKGMLHLDMATITVRVAPRSGRTAIESGPEGVVVRVRAAPEGGRATEEAARALAETLGVSRTRVRLRSGARSRTKTFDVDGLSSQDLQHRIRRS